MSAPDPARRPARFLAAVAWLALLGVGIAVGRHAGAAALATADPAAAWPASLAAAEPAAWLWAGAHLLAGLLCVPLGAWVIGRAYPLAGLRAAAAENPAAAMQQAAHVLGAAGIAGAAWGGADAASLGVAAAFTALGWLAVIALCAGHRLVTRYADHEEVADGNLAAALASAGLHLAVAIIVANAIRGDFAGWGASLTAFAIALGWGLLLWPLRQLVLARLILRLPARAMDAAVAADHDPWLGAAEGAFYVLAALLMASLW